MDEKTNTMKPDSADRKVTFVSSPHRASDQARARLAARYGDYPVEAADIVVALGGDGFMLRTLHQFMDTGVPIYGMNCGSVGFLMNEYAEDDLHARLARAEVTTLNPLKISAHTISGEVHTARALNELSLLRQTHAAAKLRISVDGRARLKELISDGILVSTPAGSTAYNFSAHGPIVPIDASLLAVTPISPFRPRRWRGALLANNAEVIIDVAEAEERRVGAFADFHELGSVSRVCAVEDTQSSSLAMFDPDHNLRERILNEQFQF